ncbi:MAG: hypothetical protein HZC47_03045 [Methanobacterium sp.]|uniref:hypothetical protein n=1 Tax=Methanobacterium sp. TaxID=2164 RepID=UPI003D646696|nr:hypothetical protein [Methanobacterium sp.]
MKKEKKLLILSLVSIVVVSTFAIYTAFKEPPTWQKTFGGPDNETGFMSINSVKLGYISLGTITISNDTDVYLISLDENGNVKWENSFGGLGKDYGYSIHRDLGGGYAIVGKTNSYGAGQYDAWLVNIDENGTPKWNITYGGPGNDSAYSFKTTQDSGFILAGSSTSLGLNGSDVYVIKTNQKGALQWQETFGGSGNEWGKSVLQMQNGSYWVLGSTNSSFANYDFYLLNLDSKGRLMLNKTFGGANDDFGDTVIGTEDNNLLLSGLTNSSGAGAFDTLIIKTDTYGNQIWNRTFGGPGNDSATFIRETDDGGYILIGDTNSFGAGGFDIFVVKFNNAGLQQWNRTFGGPGNDYAHFILETLDNGYLLTGTTNSTGAGGNDIILIKMDSLGQVK